MVFASDWHVGQVFFSMLWFFLFFIWIWLLIMVFADIFRDHTMSGFGKAAWIIFVVILPYLGVFVYLIARGGSMHERALAQQQKADEQFKQYVQSVAPAAGGGGGASAADELARLADLKSKGVITDAEFEQAKAKALA
jgi:hypothetical protein